ncbi:MAG: hypothetical protein HC919_06750 [Oscillatoriales cyanobacterium SM2_2_1]|nr:hypothetical protein [Oscillatoriales cyanobacterium SM2_2_1]
MSQSHATLLRPKNLKRLLAGTLSVTGLAQLYPHQAFAQAITPAGTNILNRATGTYEDPNNPGVTINTTSNTVTVTVAKVAGLTNIPAGIIDLNGGSVSTNDILNFDFLVTNTGNDATNIAFPAIADLVATGFTITGYQLDLNNDGDFADPGEAVQTGAFTTTTPIAANASVRVRVVGTVTATLAGAPVNVRLGDTGPNDNSAATQNQPDDGLAGDVLNAANEIRTVAAGAPPAAVAGAPVNGEREASAFQQTNVALAVNNQALATILKTRTAFAPNVLTSLTDDVLTYGLTLRVENTPPAGSTGITPAPLAPTVGVNIDGAPRDVILISDAIPVGTQLNALPTAPTGWRVVYSTDAVGGALAATPLATTVNWTTTPPAFPSTTTTRVGFILDPDGNLATASPAIPAGETIPGFSFSVVTAGLPVGGGVINNIAQVFGRTDGTAREVYDESGDQRPSNFNDDGTPNVLDNPATPQREDANNGFADPAIQGTDNANNNTGTGPGGEVNSFPIVPPGAILNGPRNQPGAVGPTNNQDDFVNQSTVVPPGLNPGDTFDPAAIAFLNTAQNPPSNPGNLDTVRLLPLAPSNASIPAASQQPDGDIPIGTRVTITLGAQVAVYDYTAAGVYTFNAGLSSGLPTGSSTILVNGLTPGTSLDYSVTVDLPAGTPLSSDRFIANGQARAGFNIPIVAFVDNDNNGAFSATNDPIFNIKIDRVYTGYVRLRKTSQIIRGGAIAPGADGTLDETPKVGRPGDIIRYVVEYVNFSTPNVGSGNVVLNATNLVIVEDGNAAPNNWVTFTQHFNNPALSMVQPRIRLPPRARSCLMARRFPIRQRALR